MRWVLLLVLCVGCGEPDEPPSIEWEESVPPPLVPSEIQGSWSNAHGFYALWRAVEGEVPLNEEFTAEVWLFEDEACTRPLEDAQVVIDCRMPAHRHGMLQDVELVHQGGGRYLALGMQCHMLGHWEVYVDLTRGALTERVQWDLELE